MRIDTDKVLKDIENYRDYKQDFKFIVLEALTVIIQLLLRISSRQKY